MGTSQDDTVYLVLDEEQADRKTVLSNLLSGEYRRPRRIVAFNATEGWARDVTAEFASEVLARPAQDDLLPAAREFVEAVRRRPK